jgi:3-phosphoshikimate 1-carboxyvinyltransferase
MKKIIHISNKDSNIAGTIDLPGSKSESNRALIIDALSRNCSILDNISTSSDTKLLQNALFSKENIIDVRDAGTAMRFLTAYYIATNQDKILTGTKRMLERPIEPLVKALNKIGGNIEYMEKQGFPPIKINGKLSKLNKNKIQIAADVSSQFISAILMIAPILPRGIELEFTGKIVSSPYIDMTLAIMHHFGANAEYTEKGISVRKQEYQPVKYNIESDWSCASYWYLMAALSTDPAIFLKGLKHQSFQGDSIIQEWFKPFGIITEFSNTGAFITKTDGSLSSLPEVIDFTDNPDLAQTMIVLCAVKRLKCKFTGLESLRIKEIDRIQAMQNELKKFNIHLIEEDKDVFSLNGTFNNSSATIETYSDHRMAMAFAPLALLCPEINIINPGCVEKSYLNFWDDLKTAGFNID